LSDNHFIADVKVPLETEVVFAIIFKDTSLMKLSSKYQNKYLSKMLSFEESQRSFWKKSSTLGTQAVQPLSRVLDPFQKEKNLLKFKLNCFSSDCIKLMASKRPQKSYIFVENEPLLILF
jgi:hypothetical protein